MNDEKSILDIIQDCQDQATLSLKKDFDAISILWNESGEHERVQEFMRQFLLMTSERNSRQLLYELFCNIIDFDDRMFLYSFKGFVSNYLLDDSFYKIVWKSDVNLELYLNRVRESFPSSKINEALDRHLKQQEEQHKKCLLAKTDSNTWPLPELGIYPEVHIANDDEDISQSADNLIKLLAWKRSQERVRIESSDRAKLILRGHTE